MVSLRQLQTKPQITILKLIVLFTILALVVADADHGKDIGGGIMNFYKAPEGKVNLPYDANQPGGPDFSNTTRANLLTDEDLLEVVNIDKSCEICFDPTVKLSKKNPADKVIMK